MDYSNEQLSFPIIHRVKLNNFSLYTLQPNAEIDLRDGVFCLAGANGLGKSTFLVTLNFALTGIVPDPDPEVKFLSTEDFYKSGKQFGDKFFRGRISEEDRSIASITVYMRVRNREYIVKRGIFEGDGLQDLQITNIETGDIILIPDNISAQARDDFYKKSLIEDLGLKTFSQYVFLQLLIFTFDERRHLLLWDERALSQAIYLAIGADYDKADTADNLRRDIEKLESRGRNIRFQESNVRNRLRDIKKYSSISLSSQEIGNLENIRIQHQELTDKLVRARKEVDDRKAQLDDINVRWMSVSSRLSTLQTEYSRIFSEHILGASSLHHHPLISSSVSEQRCGLCGNESSSAIVYITSKVELEICPLCNSPVSQEHDSAEHLARLEKLDIEMDKVKQELSGILQAKNRIASEIENLEVDTKSISERLDEFSQANETAILEIQILRSKLSSGDNIAETIARFETEMIDLDRQSREQYEKRDVKRKELDALENELGQKLLMVGLNFEPLFKNLAKLFLGIDLNISFDIKRSGIDLALDIKSTRRRTTYQLSESQRFFLDIAFRMALAQYITRDTGKATLFIDTPEGSLDIAYESKAGEMFATFVKQNNNIIMTANINSSQILLKLARDCGHLYMELHDMTRWNELSDVQEEQTDLFVDVLSHIDRVLSGAD